ncbi:hypothetical protein ACP70R_049431 [Stipagrostis hirtigluma subsp. patula]
MSSSSASAAAAVDSDGAAERVVHRRRGRGRVARRHDRRVLAHQGARQRQVHQVRLVRRRRAHLVSRLLPRWFRQGQARLLASGDGIFALAIGLDNLEETLKRITQGVFGGSASVGGSFSPLNDALAP